MTNPVLIASAALAAYNHASNIIKSLFELKISTAIVEQLNVLNKEIFAIHSSNLELQQQLSAAHTEIANLKKEIISFEQWDNQKNRYKLYSPWNGAIVYAITEANSNGEPAHWLCAKCFDERKRAFLNHRRNKDSGYEEFFCYCGYVVTSEHRGHRNVEYAPE
ncbi:MAG TPA: hypothetical protein P5102_17010 [Candidatus Competibacteraceae bacterium]|nr:hypothetical protein [Candidatus Competibacteraceae bacterium]